MPPEVLQLQGLLWQQFFSGQTQWWDNRQSKLTSRHLDFLWLDNRLKPAWVTSQLATWDKGRAKCPDFVSTSVHVQGTPIRLAGLQEVGMCRTLLEDDRIADAVDALDLLVQRGCHVDNNLFYLVLKRCIADKDLVLGSRVHALTIKSGYQGDAFLATHLIGFYASHGRLEEALRVFNKVSKPDAYSWAAIIFSYARQGEPAQAILLYRQMRESSVKPDNRIFSAVLKACASARDLDAGKEVHAHILASTGQPDVFVQTGLLDMYAKCGSLNDARRVFDRLPQRDVVSWTAMIAAYSQQGLGQEALSLYESMLQDGLNAPGSVTFLCLLQACASVGAVALSQGKQIHAQIAEKGLQNEVVLGGSLVHMYAKCSSLEDARRLFDKLRVRNVVTWNAMLAGYAQQGMGEEALSLYGSMQQEGITSPNAVTFDCLLQACASVGKRALHQGKRLHVQIAEGGLHHDLVLSGSLVNMYAKCGSTADARRVFDTIAEKNAVAWNSMIAAYVQQGMGQEALRLYTIMQQEGLTLLSPVTFVSLLQACANVGVEAALHGMELHSQIEEQGLQDDVVLGGSLVNMYAKCGSLEDARRVFDKLPVRNVVAWNAMLASYAQQGMGDEALTLYSSMQQEGITSPDSVTFVCLLKACAISGTRALLQGKELHAQIEERGLQPDEVLDGSLVNMYVKCGSTEDARRVFDRLPHKNVVTWTAMIAGYAQQGMGQEALGLYSHMQQEGISPPDSGAFVCLLEACAIVAALPLGKQLHAQIDEQGFKADPVVGAALVNMYARCGSMFDAQQVFDSLPERTIEAWGALTGGYTRQGNSKVVFDLVDRMRLEGVKPDSITFLSVLTVCSHVGLLDKGRHYFEAMSTDYGISPSVEHYTCMMDLLGRSGNLEEALQMAKTMPFPPNGVVWVTLLGACRKWNNSDIGRKALSSQ